MSNQDKAAIETKRLCSLVGENIRTYRKEQNMTQERLAELADINEKYLSSIENGKEANLSLGYLISIAVALNTSIHQLLGKE